MLSLKVLNDSKLSKSNEKELCLSRQVLMAKRATDSRGGLRVLGNPNIFAIAFGDRRALAQRQFVIYSQPATCCEKRGA